MMMSDFNNYLPYYILCKVYRASMYNSLENRDPYLDKDVIDFCFSINNKFLFKNNTSKYILKDILLDYVPKELIINKKKGFAVPISDWLENELKDWSNDFLTKEMFTKFNFFKFESISKLNNLIKFGQ